MRRLATAFAKDRSGETSVEYGLIAIGIAIAFILAMSSFGPFAAK
jgi:Flp pilus assembly pilin Flp